MLSPLRTATRLFSAHRNCMSLVKFGAAYSVVENNAVSESTKVVEIQHIMTAYKCDGLYADELHISRLLHSFCDRGLSVQMASDILLKNSNVTKRSASDVDNEVSLLLNHNFKPDAIRDIYKGIQSETFLARIGHIPELLTSLMGFKFTHAQAVSLITRHPNVVACTASAVTERYLQLLEMFTRDDINSLIRRAPELLTDSWAQIELKVQYLYDVMGVTTEAVMKSAPLRHDIHHMCLRHEYLHRAGLYERPNKHGVTRIENPPLGRLLDTPDDVFCGEVALCSVAELHAFRAMLEEADYGGTQLAILLGEEAEHDSEDEDD